MKIWELDQYQYETQRTAGKPQDGRTPEIAVLALGLTGESGEVADLLKKHLGHGHPLDKVKVVKELGDVLWYLARLADEVGVSLSDVATANVEKLRTRYPEGFTVQNSLQRAAGDT